MNQKNKEQYLALLKRYINHKLILSKVSDYYSNVQRMQSLMHCKQLMQWTIKECDNITQKKICELAIMNRKHLAAILPNQNNKSYQSSCINLETILSEANKTIKPQL